MNIKKKISLKVRTTKPNKNLKLLFFILTLSSYPLLFLVSLFESPLKRPFKIDIKGFSISGHQIPDCFKKVGFNLISNCDANTLTCLSKKDNNKIVYFIETTKILNSTIKFPNSFTNSLKTFQSHYKYPEKTKLITLLTLYPNPRTTSDFNHQTPHTHQVYFPFNVNDEISSLVCTKKENCNQSGTQFYPNNPKNAIPGPVEIPHTVNSRILHGSPKNITDRQCLQRMHIITYLPGYLHELNLRSLFYFKSKAT